MSLLTLLTRCKFTVINIENLDFKAGARDAEGQFVEGDRPAVRVVLLPQYSDNPEDNGYSVYTPAGELTLVITNINVIDRFKTGQVVYLDLQGNQEEDTPPATEGADAPLGDAPSTGADEPAPASASTPAAEAPPPYDAIADGAAPNAVETAACDAAKNAVADEADAAPRGTEEMPGEEVPAGTATSADPLNEGTGDGDDEGAYAHDEL